MRWLGLVMTVFLVSIMSPSFTQTVVTDTANRAEAAYSRGDYQTAIALYEEALTGTDNPALYFNLGNAYYESGDIGRALLNYRRAQLFWPRDTDLNRNLGLVLSDRVDLQGEETGFGEGLAASTMNLVTVTELSVTVAAIWVLWFVELGTVIFRPVWRQKLRISIVLTGLCLVIGLGLLGGRLYIMSFRPSGVIVDASVQVMSGPGKDYLELFELHAGAELHVWDERNDWLQFALPDGRLGWLPQSAVEYVVVF